MLGTLGTLDTLDTLDTLRMLCVLHGPMVAVVRMRHGHKAGLRCV